MFIKKKVSWLDTCWARKSGLVIILILFMLGHKLLFELVQNVFTGWPSFCHVASVTFLVFSGCGNLPQLLMYLLKSARESLWAKLFQEYEQYLIVGCFLVLFPFGSGSVSFLLAYFAHHGFQRGSWGENEVQLALSSHCSHVGSFLLSLKDEPSYIKTKNWI